MQIMESTFRFHPADQVASNARPTVAGGSTCGGAPSAGTSAAATTRRGNTPQPMHNPAATRSSAASNLARTGSSTIPTPHFSPVRNLNRRRITRSIKAFRAQPHASRPTGRTDCTDGDKAGPRAGDPPSACQRVDGALWAQAESCSTSSPVVTIAWAKLIEVWDPVNPAVRGSTRSSPGAVLGRVGDVGQEPVRGSRTPQQMECEQCGS